MNTLNNIWDKFSSYDNINDAIDNAAKGKHHYREVQQVFNNREKYIANMQKLLPFYYVSPTKAMKIVSYNKVRDILKLPFFPDRVIHHMLGQIFMERWTASLTRNTYASWKGRGISCKDPTYNASHQVRKAINSFKKDTKIYVLQMDIKKCYPSVNNDILMKRMYKFTSDKKVLRILSTIIYSGKGIKIGGYIDQLLINLYLSPLDRFIKQELHAKYYSRYMDDIVILSDDKSILHEWQHRIMNFIFYALDLEINHKRQVYPLGSFRGERTLDFIGYKFYRDFQLMRSKTKTRYKRKRHLIKSTPSYRGIACKCNGINLMNTVNNNLDLNRDVFKVPSGPYDGKSIQIGKLINKEFTIISKKLYPSAHNPKTYLFQISLIYLGHKRHLKGTYKYITKSISLLPDNKLPLTCKLRFNKRHGYYLENITKLTA